MIEIKITLPDAFFPLIRQTPHSSGVWGNCRFHINQAVERCDYWVVLDGLSEPERTKCSRKNTILIANEFPSIKPRYDQAFLDQFGTIITYSRAIDHPRVIDAIAHFPWFVGIRNPGSESAMHEFLDYEGLASIDSSKKTKLISVVSSDKVYTRGHRDRIAFVDKLQKHFGRKIDVFGRGRRGFPDKLDVLLDYKYHVALENSSCRNGITEKLSDPFLTLTYPVYYGAPNVFDYFPKQAMSVIDIKRPKEAIALIEELIAEDAYDDSFAAIKTARKLVLEKYNIFALLAEYCAKEAAASSNSAEESVVDIAPERLPARGLKERLEDKVSRWLGLAALRASNLSRSESAKKD